jgi:hypothetical protein
MASGHHVLGGTRPWDVSGSAIATADDNDELPLRIGKQRKAGTTR